MNLIGSQHWTLQVTVATYTYSASTCSSAVLLRTLI